MEEIKKITIADLNEKQKAFVKNYLTNGFNQKQAAISAGYADKSAEFNSSRLMRNDKVKQVIDDLVTEALDGELVRLKAETLSELKSIAFSNIIDVIDEKGEIDLNLLDFDKSKPVKTIWNERTVDKKNKEIYYEKVKITYHDKIKGLELLCKYLGMLTDEHKPDVKYMTFMNLSDEQLRKIVDSEENPE